MYSAETTGKAADTTATAIIVTDRRSADYSGCPWHNHGNRHDARGSRKWRARLCSLSPRPSR